MTTVRYVILSALALSLSGCAFVDWYVEQAKFQMKLSLYFFGAIILLCIIPGYRSAQTLATRMILYAIGFLIVYSLLGSDYPNISVILLIGGVLVGALLFARDSGLLDALKQQHAIRNEERRQQQERVALAQAEQARLTAQRQALTEHERAQGDADQGHKRKLAARHLNQLALYAEDLDGSEEDRAFLDQMMRESVAFIEDGALARAVREDDALQQELLMLLTALETRGLAQRAIFTRLSTLKRQPHPSL
jgi:hypothetical protein